MQENLLFTEGKVAVGMHLYVMDTMMMESSILIGDGQEVMTDISC